MVVSTTKVPRPLKRALIREAGGKCANPGCANSRSHFHHIQDWAVYETHDQKHMIAICPACHDAVHHGELKIDDQTLYQWKGIQRPGTKQAHIYIEPRQEAKLLLGSVALTGPAGVAFHFSSTNQLSFRLVNNEILMLNLCITTVSGTEIIRITDGYVSSSAGAPIRFIKRPGHIKVSAPIMSDILPTWALDAMRAAELYGEPSFASNGELPVLDLEVLEPGLARVQGIWAEKERAVLVTRERLAVIKRGDEAPCVSVTGAGTDTIFKHNGTIFLSLFPTVGAMFVVL